MKEVKIVVLDGYTLNPGDLSWDALQAWGETAIYDRTPVEQIYERAKEADIILTNKTPLAKDIIEQLPKLRYIGVLATGYNIIDMAAARTHGIVVTNVPSYSTGSVAQFVFAMMLEFCHHIAAHNEAVHHGEWTNSIDFSFTKSRLTDLEGKTIGIVGFGSIGQQVARIASAMGMHVLAYSRTTKQVPGLEHVVQTKLERLLRESDFVSLHCPLTAETEKMIRCETLSLMKRDAILINTARGGLIHEQDLADALNEGCIAGAALDVLSKEPPQADHPLLQARHCIITPHIAWATFEARKRLMATAVANIAAFRSGHPQNTV